MAPRRYDSPVRRRRMAATRHRIVAAGVELVRDFKTWDWSGLTFRAVAERAGVGERTVYRHFPTERALHAGIMAGLATEAGVDYDTVTLGTVAEVAGRVFRSFGTLHVRPPVDPPPDPAFMEADRQRRAALLRAVSTERPGWTEARQVALAAVLDVLWGPDAYEQLVDRWGLEPERAEAILAGAIDALIAATPDP